MLTRRTYRLWLACGLGLTVLLTACQPIQPMADGAVPAAAAEEDRGNFPATTAVDDEWSQMKKIVDLPNGISLRYVEMGPADAPVMLLLHGITDNSRGWSEAAALLAEKYRLLIPDQRNHGDSEQPACCGTVAEMAYDASLFLQAMGVEKATVVGHSMGSFVAQMVAIMYPEQVDQLILVATAGRAGGRPGPKMNFDIAQAAPDDTMPADHIEQWYGAGDALATARTEGSSIAAHAWANAFIGQITHDSRDLLPDLAMPVLVLWGDQDPVFPEDRQLELREVMPQATYITYEGIGHNTHIDHAEQVVQDMIAFIDGK